jgi:ATP-dependent RNA helicase DHX29
VVWSKDQDTEYEKNVDGVLCTLHTLWITFTAATIAAVSVEQSEGFISTVALFSLFVSSPKEEKLYLRLPTNWRELYREYLEQRKTRIDAEDRETIQKLRSLIQEQLDTEESEGIVLINRFKLRNQATSNSSTSNSGRNTPLAVNEGLRDFWWQKASTPAYQRMLLKRANLPVFGFRASILSTIDQNQVTIICGETGCGKSTQIPSYILEHEISQGNACKVYCRT